MRSATKCCSKDGWHSHLLGELLDLNYGAGLPRRSRAGGNVPVFGSNGCVGFHSEALTHGPTIIVGRKGSIGEVAWSDIACWPIDTTYYIDSLRTPSSLKYVFYGLKFLDLPSLDKSSAVPGLDRQDVYKLTLTFPSTVDEQEEFVEAIESRLGVADRMYRSAESQRTALTALEMSLLRQSFDTPLSGNWKPARLGQLAGIVMGQSPDGSTYNKAGNGMPLLNGPTEFGEDHPTPVQWTTRPRKLCQPDDLLLCVRGNTTGRMNRADQVYALGRGVAAVRGKAGRGHTRFIRHAIHYRLAGLLLDSGRSTFPNIGRDDIAAFEVYAPQDVGEQEQFAAALDVKLSQVRSLRSVTRRQGEAISTLPASTLREFFNFGIGSGIHA